jgi:hypothetical protein
MMSDKRGWNNGVYNPGLSASKDYLERVAQRLGNEGITELTEIKGVSLRDSGKREQVLSAREQLELDRIGVRAGAHKRAFKPTPEQVEEFNNATDLVTVYKDGVLYPFGDHLVRMVAPDSDEAIFHTNLCPEVTITNAYLFQHAGHLWKITRTDWSIPGITGVVELYIPTAEDLIPIPVDLGHDYDIPYPSTGGRFSHIAQFVDLTKETSQSVRNETMAVYLDPVCAGEPEVLTPEDLLDREQAIQEASEGKLDYLLEGTQWDPKNRK